MADDTDYSDLGGYVPFDQRAQAIAHSVINPQPDQAGKALTLAPQVGLPPAIVRDDPAGAAADLQRQQNITTMQQHPAIAQVVAAQPTAYEAMADEMPAVAKAKDDANSETFFGNITKAISDPAGYFTQRNSEINQGLSNVGSALTGGVASGVAAQDYGMAASKYMLGDKSEIPELQQYEARQEPQWSGAATYTAQQVGQLAGQLFESARTTGTVAAVGGGALGSTLPGVGTAAGLASGMGFGTVAGLAESAAGAGYRKLDLARDRAGNPLPESLKVAGSLTLGLLNGMLFSKAGGAATEGLSSLVTEGMISAFSDSAVQSTAVKLLNSAAKNGLTFGLINGGLSAADTLIPDLAKTEANKFDGGKFETVFNNPEMRRSAVAAVTTAIRDGVVGGGLLGALPIGANVLLDQVHLHQVAAEAATRDQAMASAEATQLKSRAPDVLSQVIGNGKTINVSADKIAEVRASDPTAFNYIPNVEEVVAQAQAHGGDVPIPAGEYYSKTPAETHEIVKDDIRGDGGLTVNEARDLSARTEAILAKGPEGEASSVDGKPEGMADGMGQPAIQHESGVESPVEGLVTNIETNREAHENPVGEATATAVEANLAAERKLMWLEPLMTPDAAGLNKADFARYSKALQDLQAKTTTAVFKAAEKEIRKREAPLWANSLKEASDAVRDEMLNRPDIYADRLLRNGSDPTGQLNPVIRPKLDREASRDLLGPSTDSEGSVDSLAGLDPKFFAEEGGLHPDEAAQLTGHKNGTELLRQLKELQSERDVGGFTPKEHLDAIVKDEALRRVEGANGKFDETIMREAIDAAMSVEQLDVLVAEFHLAGGDQQVTRDSILAEAARQHGEMPAGKGGNVEAFQRLAGKFGNLAQSKLLAGDKLGGLQAKQRQTLNLALAKEAMAFRREAEVFAKKARGYITKLMPEGVDHTYAAQIQRLFRDSGIDIKRDSAELDRYLEGKPNLKDFAEGRQRETGRGVSVPEFMTVKGLDVTKLSVDQMRGYRQVVTALDNGGRWEREINLYGETQDLAELTREASAKLALRPEKPVLPEAPKMGKAWLKDTLHSIHADLLIVEKMAKWFDIHDPSGPFTRVMRAVQDAKYAEADMKKEYGAKLADLSQGKAWEKSLSDKLPNENLIDPLTLRPREFTRHSMLNMMKHLGSELNERKLVDGMNAYGRDRHGDAWAPLTWDRETVRRFVEDNATKADWNHVQGTWDLFEGLWPKVEQLAWRTTGVAPVKRVPRPIKTKFGTYDGGYAPLRVDSFRQPHIGQGTKGLFDAGNFMSSSPPAGYSKVVTGALYAVDLDPGVTANGLRETLHDLAFREPLADANKFFSQRNIKEAIEGAFGRQMSERIRPWMEDVAGGGIGAADRGVKGMAAILKTQRQNWGAAQLVLRASAIAKHGSSVIFQSIAEVGAKPFAQELLSLYSNPLKAVDNVSKLMEISGELRTRHSLRQQDLVEMDPTIDHGNPWASFADWGHAVFNTIDMMSAAPTFSARYKQALAQGFSEYEAAHMGDAAVRAAHGSLNIVDRPAMLRSQSEFVKEGTVAYAFFNHVYNQDADILQTMKDKKADLIDESMPTAKSHNWGKMLFKTLTYTVMMSLVEDLVSPQPKNKDESYAGYVAKELLRVPLGTVPFARDAADQIMGRDKGPSPGLEANSMYAGRTIKNIVNLLTGGKISSMPIRDAAGALALFAPVPGAGQAGQTAQFLWDETHEPAVKHADDFGQWVRGLLMGHAKPSKGH